MKDDGTMARVDDLIPYCREHGLKLVTVADLIEYRRRRERLVDRVATVRMPTAHGEFTAVAFQENARDLAGNLSRRYHTAKVLTFSSPAGDWWVRVRVKDDLRARAEEVMHQAKTSEGAVFLVRLD